MVSCVSFQALACVPAAAVASAASNRCAARGASSSVVSTTWGQQVSLKASIVHPLRQARSASHIARQAAVAELSEFAVHESAKFREGLLQQLAANERTASEKGKIADVCAKIFGDYCEKYDGSSLSPAPFGEMKEALDGEGLPASEVAICAAIGWARGYLHHDWKTWEAKK